MFVLPGVIKINPAYLDYKNIHLILIQKGLQKIKNKKEAALLRQPFYILLT